MGKIHSFVNQKGGVGKTTSTINLGSYLASYGQKVLMIDLDPQANATSSLGIDKTNVEKGTYEVIIGEVPITPYIMHNKKLRLSILPSTTSLAGAEIELIDIEDREYRLQQALSQVADRYDYILIDCPPSLSLLTINGLTASKDGVLIPLQCEYLALEGLGQLVHTISLVRDSLFPQLFIRGVLLTMFDGRTNLASDVVNEIKQHFPQKVFNAIIPRSVRIAEAPSYGIPISVHAPNSPAAKAYCSLARELLSQDEVVYQEMILD